MKQVIVLGSLLAVSLVGSYLTWTADEPSQADQEKVAMYRAEEGDLQKIVWKGEDLTIELERRTDGLGDYTWITATELVAKKKEAPAEGPAPSEPEAPEAEEAEVAEGDPAEQADAAAPAEEPVEKETRITAFKGNDAADKLWAAFAPLRAIRELEVTATTDRSVFGLDEPKGTLEVLRANGALSLAVGGETWGSRDRYVGVDQRVFLVDDADLRPLQYGKTRLVERNLQPVAEADMEKVEITRADAAIAFVQKNREDRAKAFWARDGQELEDTVGATWLDKLNRLRVHAYVDEKDAPALEPVFSYAVSGKGKTWKVEILRETGVDSPEYYARSEFDRALVKLTKSLASEAVADLDSVFAAPPR